MFRPRTTIDADGTVEGYASLFGEIDAARDMVMPGAFRQTLKLRGPRRVPMLFQHDPSEPIGIWLDLVEDGHGLKARGRLIPEVMRARELLALVKAGAVDGLSIGFRTVKGAPIRAGRACESSTPSISGRFPSSRSRCSRGRASARSRKRRSPPGRVSFARARAEREWKAIFAAPAAEDAAAKEPLFATPVASRVLRNRAHATAHAAAARAHPRLDRGIRAAHHSRPQARVREADAMSVRQF